MAKNLQTKKKELNFYLSYIKNILNNMKNGEMKIDEKGKIVIAGELFYLHRTDSVVVPFEGYLDTGCTHDMVVPLNHANAVCAQVENEHETSGGAGATTIQGTMRRVNVCLGGLEAQNLRVFVPNNPSERILIGIGLLQKISAYMAIDFHSGTTEGSILTTDRNIPFLVGKVLHCKLIHNKEIVSKGPCDFCGQVGREN